MNPSDTDNRDTIELLTAMELLAEINLLVEEYDDRIQEYCDDGEKEKLADEVREREFEDGLVREAYIVPEEDEVVDSLDHLIAADLNSDEARLQREEELKRLEVESAKEDESRLLDEYVQYYSDHNLDGEGMSDWAQSEPKIETPLDMRLNELVEVLSKISSTDDMINICLRLRREWRSSAIYLLCRSLALKSRFRSALAIAKKIENVPDRRDALRNILNFSRNNT